MWMMNAWNNQNKLNESRCAIGSRFWHFMIFPSHNDNIHGMALDRINVSVQFKAHGIVWIRFPWIWWNVADFNAHSFNELHMHNIIVLYVIQIGLDTASPLRHTVDKAHMCSVKRIVFRKTKSWWCIPWTLFICSFLFFSRIRMNNKDKRTK